MTIFGWYNFLSKNENATTGLERLYKRTGGEN